MPPKTGLPPFDPLAKPVDLISTQTPARFQFYRVQPEFRNPFARGHMDMRRFAGVVLVAVEENPIRAFAQECRHQPILAGWRSIFTSIRAQDVSDIVAIQQTLLRPTTTRPARTCLLGQPFATMPGSGSCGFQEIGSDHNMLKIPSQADGHARAVAGDDGWAMTC